MDQSLAKATAQVDAQDIARSRRQTVDEMLARNARKWPDKVAVRYGSRALTFSELQDRAMRMAEGMRNRGLQPGDRVATVAHNGIEAVECWFAALAIGAIVVPVNFRFTASEIAHVLRDSGASMIYADDALLQNVEAAAVEMHFDGLLFSTASERSTTGAEAYEALFASQRYGESGPNEEDLAFLIYTSGTTGAPKGAALTHRNLVIHTFNFGGTLGIVLPDEVLLAGMPQFHIGGVDQLLYAFMVGGTSIIMDTGHFDASEIADLMAEYRVTSAFFVPTQAADLVKVPDLASRSFALRRVAWGAANAPRSVVEDLLAAFPGIGIYAIFGQSEMSAGTCMLPTHLYPEKLGSVGQPVMNVEVRIVDDEMRDVATGAVGEIVYRGATVMQGYWNRPDATAEAFDGGWFHSGDLCRMDDEGFVYIVDRKKDMVISGGENIYCAEVEAAIVTHAKVSEVAVIGIPHPRWGETPLAVIIPVEESDPPTLEEIVAHTAQSLARYKLPSDIRVISSLPRNTLGKVQKFALRERFGSTAPLSSS